MKAKASYSKYGGNLDRGCGNRAKSSWPKKRSLTTMLRWFGLMMGAIWVNRQVVKSPSIVTDNLTLMVSNIISGSLQISE